MRLSTYCFSLQQHWNNGAKHCIKLSISAALRVNYLAKETKSNITDSNSVNNKDCRAPYLRSQ
jgi:hypothetical protein